MPAERSATTRDGRRLTYAAEGSGPPLVCHPGGPGFPGAYFRDLAGLAEVCTVVRVDPAGTAGSDPWTEDAWSLTERAHDLDDLRRALGAATIDVLGHSAGGWVAARYAALHPGRVRRLLLVDTLTRFSDPLRDALAAQAQLHATEPWFEAAATAHGRRVSGDYSDEEEFLELYKLGFRFYFARFGERERAFVDGIEEWVDRRTLDSFNARAGELDLRPDLPSITAPTLVVNGEHDATGVCADEFLEGIAGSVSVVVEGAGHFPWIEQPERFRAAVEPFLSS
jgi:pimeloyl-ACP methyl ester carboxylesterase